ncbi:MAG: aspartate aminotransferase family protein [Thermoflexales bacterium]|nr:aspartate aminotransferase family protein [Thermoflexales bacterium]
MTKSYERSRALFERARKSLAGGVSSEFRKFNSPHPFVYARGEGSHVVDVDENDYLDFTLSQGPLILGHSHPEVLARVERASRDGQLYAALHLGEIELAETLQRLIPGAELIRFNLSGSEADHAALRVARAVTGRPKFLRFEGHYHGWFDNVAFAIGAPNLDAMGPREAPTAVAWSQGLPDAARGEFITCPWNDLALVERVMAAHGHEIAAIITEPVMCNAGCIEPRPGYLQGLRALADRYGCALIFDEVITGFRIALGGAQSYYGVTPDLSVFAKAMANGYPISAIVGRQRWMQPIAEGKVVHAGTMNAGNATVAAAQATIDILERDNVNARLHRLGRRLIDGLREAARATGQNAVVLGPGPMAHLGFADTDQIFDFRDTLRYDKAKGARFINAMQEHGVRVIGRGLWYISGAHTEGEIDHAIATARAVFETLV